MTAGGVQADAGEATPARASDAGASCSAGQPIVNDFEHGGVVGTDPSFEGVVTSNSIDATNPIDGAASLKIALSGAAYGYLNFEEPAMCRLTVAFELRPGADLIANGASLVEVAETVTVGLGGTFPTVRVNPGGTLTVSDIAFNVQSSTATVLASSPPVGHLVAGRVSTISLRLDLGAKTITLTVDGQSTGVALGATDYVAGFSGIEVGATQPLPATAAGTFWLDDLKISSDEI